MSRRKVFIEKFKKPTRTMGYLDFYLDDNEELLEIRLNESHIKDDLNLNGYSNVILPEGLIVDGHLEIKNSRLKKLPDNLVVNNYLDIQGSDIESMENARISGTLYAAGSKMADVWWKNRNILREMNSSVKGDVYFVEYY